MLKKILAVLAMLCATLALAAVDVNKATEAQLDSIKGIGPATSKLIQAERKKAEFKSWDDFIERVKGLGPARAGKLSAEGLTVNGAPYKAAAAKVEKKEANADAKSDKKVAKVEMSKPAASAAKK